MKRSIFILITFIVLFFSGCKHENSEPVPLTEDIYTPAASAFSANKNISMEITHNKTTTLGANVYCQKQNRQVVYQNYGTDTMIGQSTGTISFGDYVLQVNEIRANNKVYLTLNQRTFCSDSTSTETFYPTKLLEPSHYGSIMVSSDKKVKTIYYTEANHPENWALPEGASFINSSATAVLSKNNQLLSTSYIIDYSHGSTQVRDEYVIQYKDAPEPTIQIPAKENCANLQDVYGPLYLEQAYGYLKQITTVNAALSENITSQASTISYKQLINISRSKKETAIQTDVLLSDSSRGSESSYTQTERYADGLYTISKDGSEPVNQPNMDHAAMSAYVSDLLVKNIPSCSYVEACNITLADNIMKLQIQSGEALAETICQNSCQTIYQDANFLDSKSSNYENYQVEYFISIDPISGLPLTSRLSFSGIHKIEEIDYTLLTTYTQEYSYPS